MPSSGCGSLRPAARICCAQSGSPSMKTASGIQCPSRTRETMLREKPRLSASVPTARIAASVVGISRRRASAPCTRAKARVRCARRTSPSSRSSAWSAPACAISAAERPPAVRGQRVGDVIERAVERQLGGVLRQQVAGLRLPERGHVLRCRRAAPRRCARAARRPRAAARCTSHGDSSRTRGTGPAAVAGLLVIAPALSRADRSPRRPYPRPAGALQGH